MQSEQFYRVTIDGVGIYAAVDAYCPKGDSMREHKPDGSWLKRVGKKFPGAISYWTEKGLKRYKESGLFDWHKSVVQGYGAVEIAELDKKPKNVLYEDEYQIIVNR